jgi:3D-(3,5/4)-trihydroxycyclohexane-1,2-dione acylhydrolase (decyclizing)
MWTTEAKDSYHMEYGYSCMGYEISGAVGAKLAEPRKPVYAMVGDGSFYMLHSELLTAVQEGLKITILLFDNASNGCINNLQMGSGLASLGTEFRHRGQDGGLTGKFIETNFAQIAEGYGAKAFQAKTLPELVAALIDSKREAGPVLIDMKVLPKTMTEPYLSWWRAGLAEVSAQPSSQQAHLELQQYLKRARLY